MKKQVTIKKDVFYCDICGKKIEKKAVRPFVNIEYQTVYNIGGTLTLDSDHEYFGCNLDLCANHCKLLGRVVREKVEDTLAFLEDEQKVKDEINKQEE